MIRVIKLELRRNVNKTGIAIFIIFVFFAVLINNASITILKNEAEKKEQFIEVETQKIENYFAYSLYGMIGFRTFFSPSNISPIFQNSTSLTNLQALIDAGARLNFNRPEIGEYIFKKPTGGNLDLSWYLLVIMSIFILIWGWFSFRNTEYLKFLMSFCDSGLKCVYLGILLSRIFLTIISLLGLTLIIWLQFVLNGIILNTDEITSLLLFILVLTFVMIFLLILGSIFGTIKSIFKGALFTFLCWLVLVLLWPEFLNLMFSNRAKDNIKSVYNHEIEKLKIMTAFEQMAIKYSSKKEDSKKADKEMSEHFLANESKKIEMLESQMIEKTEKYAKKFHFASIINPTTFYKSVNNELSSKGFNSYIDFYKENKQKKRDFIRFYFEKRMQPATGKVEPYLSGEKYIFNAKSSLPEYFGAGLILNFIYILILLLYSYYRFNRIIFPQPENTESFKELAFNFNSGGYLAFRYDITDNNLPDQLFNAFMGKAGKFSGKISVDGESILSTVEKQDFVYLPCPDAIPGNMKNRVIINLIAGYSRIGRAEKSKLKKELGSIVNKKFEDIENVEKIEMLLKLAALTKTKIYLLNNLFYHLPVTSQSGKICAEIFEKLGLRSKEFIIIELVSMSPLKHSCFDCYSAINLEHSIYKEDIIQKGK